MRVARAQALQHFQTGKLGQAEIENQQIEILGGQHRIGFQSVLDAIGGIAGLAQGTGQAIGQNGIVFGKQDSHGEGEENVAL
ncbi:hypothetical protein GCM10011430_13100 [Oxalicibacterium solurbis]|uniref:Uncharacterized protein n=1 Tax=Oxalicibacterium solurbis TaxID=69280 RepID=A0A8J3F622_9BURK|nr:hypothetical protein GCM10011430_13100 [Oxalicibacterium solurbis]